MTTLCPQLAPSLSQTGVDQLTQNRVSPARAFAIATPPMVLSAITMALVAAAILLVLVCLGGTPFYDSAGLLWLWLFVVGLTIVSIVAALGALIPQPWIQYVATILIVIQVGM